MIITASDVSTGSTTNDSTLALTFITNEATSNFVVTDIAVTNGSLSSFVSTDDDTYTATFTPDGDGATTIDVAAGAYTDAAGNNNTAASQFAWTYDGTGPTMTIASTTSGVTDGSTTNDALIALTFTSSEVTTDFAANDINVSNGTLSSFAGSGTDYTATFTPVSYTHLTLPTSDLV